MCISRFFGPELIVKWKNGAENVPEIEGPKKKTCKKSKVCPIFIENLLRKKWPAQDFLDLSLLCVSLLYRKMVLKMFQNERGQKKKTCKKSKICPFFIENFLRKKLSARSFLDLSLLRVSLLYRKMMLTLFQK